MAIEFSASVRDWETSQQAGNHPSPPGRKWVVLQLVYTNALPLLSTHEILPEDLCIWHYYRLGTTRFNKRILLPASNARDLVEYAQRKGIPTTNLEEPE